MAENETMEPQVETPETNYVKIIQDLKRTTVSRDEYNRVLEDNKMLANALATTPERKEESTDDSAKVATDEEVQALRDKLYNQSCGGMSNLDSMETILDLRDAVLSRGERDPFLPTAEDYVETEETVKTVRLEQRLSDRYVIMPVQLLTRSSKMLSSTRNSRGSVVNYLN